MLKFGSKLFMLVWVFRAWFMFKLMGFDTSWSETWAMAEEMVQEVKVVLMLEKLN